MTYFWFKLPWPHIASQTPQSHEKLVGVSMSTPPEGVLWESRQLDIYSTWQFSPPLHVMWQMLTGYRFHRGIGKNFRNISPSVFWRNKPFFYIFCCCWGKLTWNKSELILILEKTLKVFYTYLWNEKRYIPYMHNIEHFRTVWKLKISFDIFQKFFTSYFSGIPLGSQPLKQIKYLILWD